MGRALHFISVVGTTVGQQYFPQTNLIFMGYSSEHTLFLFRFNIVLQWTVDNSVWLKTNVSVHGHLCFSDATGAAVCDRDPGRLQLFGRHPDRVRCRILHAEPDKVCRRGGRLQLWPGGEPRVQDVP